MVKGKVAVQYSVIQPVRPQTKYNKKVESIFHALFRRTLKNVVKPIRVEILYNQVLSMMLRDTFESSNSSSG